ncbi:MAG: tetratricopeptide repeat protein [Sphingobacteriales bacterium]|uniref:tetratricopeptide repeat protein n=1 Tax=Hydrotalea flava TaxID=714549 RepID=UPI000FC127F8|nr:tetratricopeptide repeat protein [Hydrotalea flava]RTL51089.1 MAG: tetratricopeptide repeat protein [Sphingobacteriales bacterium]
MKKKAAFPILLAVLLVTTLVYWNHFYNTFHFDDEHTIVNNVYIRSLKYIPSFFIDGTTFSTLPQNQSYRPIVSLTLAIDYWLAGGYHPFWFQLDDFIVFLFQGVLLFYFFIQLFNLVQPNTVRNTWLAAFGVAWYMLHPANAETINYIIARSDLQSTMLVVLAFVVYQYFPQYRKKYLYLLPIIVGALAKPTAVMFAPIFLVYLLYFECHFSIVQIFQSKYRSQAWQLLRSVTPIFIVCILMYIWVDKMTPATWVPGGNSPLQYLLTQPYIIAHYFGIFFVPIHLSADTDWGLLPGITDIRFIVGLLFVLALLSIAIVSSFYQKWRPVSFGILWFFLALIPTSSIFPLAEVLNYHRIFFPYIGLMISVVWTIGVLLEPIKQFMHRKALPYTTYISITALLCLSFYAYGTIQRNAVWHTEESLWKNVTENSPANGRGLMNYGLTQMNKGDYATAEKYFVQALQLLPNYHALQINMAIINDIKGDTTAASAYFKRALALGPEYPESCFFYGRYLMNHQQDTAAIPYLQKAIELSPAYIDARMLLLQAYSYTHEWQKLLNLATLTLQWLPNNATVLQYIEMAKTGKDALTLQEQNIDAHPNAAAYIDLSLQFYQKGDYEGCIRAAQKALKILPNYAEAYNNIGSAYIALKQYDKAIAPLQKAIALKPGFQIAMNNLAIATEGSKNNANK